MKILIANWIYDWGSTGYIVRDLLNELTTMGHQVVVATAQNKGEGNSQVFEITKPSEWKWFWRLHRLGLSKLRGSTAASKRLIQLIENEKPDVVNLHLLHGNRINLYYLLKYLGEHSIKTVVTNHAELYYTGSCGHAYDCNRWINSECKKCPNVREATDSIIFGNPHRNWKLMQKAFSYFKPENLLFTSVSPWVKSRFLQSPIANGFECEVVLNGLDVEVFQPRYNNTAIAERIGAENYILHVTATFNPTEKNDVKGAYYLMKLAEAIPEKKFVVAATSIVNAKDQSELAELYSAATLTVLVSRRETFSMVTAESLCCGTPVVGFKAGGPETISIQEYSQFVEQGNLVELVGAIQEMTAKEFDRKTISEEARTKYSQQTMAKGYLKLYEEVLKR